MMRRLAVRFRLAGAAMLLAPGIAMAQTINCTANPLLSGNCSANANVTLRTNRVLQVTLSVGSTALAMPPGNGFDLSGIDTTFTTGPTVTVVSSVPWSLQVASTTTNWTVVPALPVAKPASDMKYSWTGPVSSSATMVGLSTTATTVTQSTSQGRLPLVNIALTYNAIWKIATDAPGAYSMTIVFNMTAP